MNAKHKLKDVAGKVGISVSTLQLWDRNGTFKASRTDSGRRYYTDEQLAVLLAKKSKSVAECCINVGDKFGHLTVLACVDENALLSKMKYSCMCDCGTVIEVRRSDLLSGNTQSCGCLRTESFVRHHNVLPDGTSLSIIQLSDLPGRRRTADFTGLTFGRLTVLCLDKAYVRNCGKTAVMWKCKCVCGNEVIVDAQALRSGHTKSCGCYEKDCPSRTVDLTGRRFGKLVVLHQVPGVNSRRYAKWHCRCDCGNECDVISSDLVHGMTASCGCLKASKCELLVSQYFDANGLRSGIDYFPQYTYPELKGTGGRVLSYDFLVYRDNKPICLIECQGEQHYVPVKWYGGTDGFEQQQEHDRRKREYAKQIGVPLLELPPTCRTYESVEEKLDSFFHSINFNIGK